MATRKFIVTTSLADARPVMYRGASVYSMYQQIFSLLSRRFKETHALLLAEPVADPKRNTVDWYSGATGDVHKWSDLSPEARQELKVRLASLASDISIYAEELKQARDPYQANIGNFLALAQSFPDERCLYVIGGQPVMICWGFTEAAETITSQTLTRFSAVQDPRDRVAEVVTRTDKSGGETLALADAAQVKISPVAVRGTPRGAGLWLPLLAFIVGFGLASAAAYFILFVLPPLAGMGGSGVLAEEQRREAVLRDERQRLLATLAQTCKAEGWGGVVKGTSRREVDPKMTQKAGREMDERLRRAGGALSGDVVISLLWKSTNDLDLMVESPEGEKIFFRNKGSASGGVLDLDANVSSTTDEPIENIVWGAGRAPKGKYKVFVGVANVRDSNPGASDFAVRVQNGSNIDFFTGTARRNETSIVTEFTRN